MYIVEFNIPPRAAELFAHFMTVAVSYVSFASQPRGKKVRARKKRESSFFTTNKAVNFTYL